MHAPIHKIPAHLEVILTLSSLLERLETSPTPFNAAQYRAIAQNLATELSLVKVDADLMALLNAFPAAAELYENVRYAHAGLCRAPLEQSLNSEMAARAAIDHAINRGTP